MNDYQFDGSNKRWKVCECCGQKTIEWKENMTKGLARMLVKLHKSIESHGKNDINIFHQMHDKFELTHTEKCNWSKLRYHGLVFKVKDEDKNSLQGRWGLTQRGYDFLHNGLAIHKFVWSYNGHISDAPDARSDELVTLKDIVKMEVVFNSIEDFEGRQHGNES